MTSRPQRLPHTRSTPRASDAVDVLLQRRLGQAVLGDAEAQHAARLGLALVHRRLVAEQGQLAGGRQSARAGADHGDLLLVPDLGLLGQRHVLVGEVGDEALEAADGDGRLDLAARAVDLALAPCRRGRRRRGRGWARWRPCRPRRTSPRGSGPRSPAPTWPPRRRACRASAPSWSPRRCWGSPAGRACRSPCARRGPRCRRRATLTGHTGTHSPQLVHLSGSTKRAWWKTLAVKLPGSPSRPVELRVGDDVDVQVPPGLDQLGGQGAHRAVVGGEGLVELRHVAAEGRRLLDEVDLVAALGEVEGALDAGDAAA